MSAVNNSLTRLENEHQEILDRLHELRQNTSLEDGDLDILDELEEIVEDWDRILSGDIASETVGKKLKDVHESDDRLRKMKELDLLLDPLRHYVIALEKYQREEYRETVTRSAMVIERIVRELAIELSVNIKDKKTEDSFGVIQNGLEATDVWREQDFVAEMRAIYSIRNDRGPHDVPAAALIQAKRSIAMLMWIYFRYLEIISEVGTAPLPEEDVRDFTDLLDIILEFNPKLVMGEGGGEPTVRDLIVDDLYRNGFFREAQNLSHVVEALSAKRYNPDRTTVAHNLKELTGDILTRLGSRGSYRYIEKIPPDEYFN